MFITSIPHSSSHALCTVYTLSQETGMTVTCSNGSGKSTGFSFGVQFTKSMHLINH